MTPDPTEPSEPKAPSAPVRAHRKIQESARMHPGVMFGSSFAVAMGVFAWLGHRWDEKTGRAPLGVLLGVGVGLLYGAYEVWKLIQEPRPPAPASDAEQADAAEVADTDRPS